MSTVEQFSALVAFLGDVDSRIVWFGYGDDSGAVRESPDIECEVECHEDASAKIRSIFQQELIQFAAIEIGVGVSDCVELWKGQGLNGKTVWAAIEPTRETLLAWTLSRVLKTSGVEQVERIVRYWEEVRR